VRPTMTYSGPTDLYIAGTWRPAAAGARFTITDPGHQGQSGHQAATARTY